MGILLTPVRPADRLLTLFQNGRSIEEYVEEFLELSYLRAWNEETLKSVFWYGLEDHLYQQVPAATIPCSLAQYIDFMSPDIGLILILVQYKAALLANETSAQSHPLNTLALQLVHENQYPIDYSYNSKTITKEMDKNQKDNHGESLKAHFDLQNKRQCYSTLNRTTKLANYLLIKQFKERQILSKYRLSDNDLELEKARRRQTWDSERSEDL
ncbi:hypothetical protein DPX16_23637 [Anabarilius grahami]|uniref:Retrotransposon gag domain-containing protein n=1 Tax=Anabarilius grahami TaxID=495550 RepID=A0A3N0ZB10_ANAGA|nr:hypothetical protein DPX16_23637 [Anabarilius grahami]